MLGKPLATKFSDPSMKEALRAAMERMMAGQPPGELDVQFATHAGADVSCSLMMAIPGNVSVRKRVRVVGVMISITGARRCRLDSYSALVCCLFARRATRKRLQLGCWVVVWVFANT